jgi:hopene-associated glycosyltransferase HpnB
VLILAVLAAVPLWIWIYLLAARGGFWRIREDRVLEVPPAAPVAVVIPARDEAESVGAAIRSLLEQQYPGELHIFLTDDHSTDGTAAAASAAAAGDPRLTITPGADLPSGWTGKLWAVQQSLEKALAWQPDWILFTDADIVHAPDSVASLVARACRDQLDLASYMVRLRCRTLAERALIPAFVYFFFKLYPPAWIADPHHSMAGAAGGCMLVKPSVLVKGGGVAAIGGDLIDDCALARLVKRAGSGRIWLGVTATAYSVRGYPTFNSVTRMIARTAYSQLNYSPLLLAGTLAGMAVTYLAAPALTLFASGVARWLGFAAWGLMSLSYLPVLRFYRQPFAWAAALPLIAAFYTRATWLSAFRHWQGRGGEWKGRTVSPRAASSKP